MKRCIPGLHANGNGTERLEGIFLVRVERAFYRWHPQKPFLEVRFAVLRPADRQGHPLTGRLYCTPKALWKLNWFLRDFGYDSELLSKDEVDGKSLLGLSGIVRVSQTVLNGRSFLNLDAFAPAAEWQEPVPEPSHDL